MSRTSVLGLSIFATAALAQLGGQYTQEVHPLLPTQQCTTHGCKTMNTSIVLDSNYRWLHNNGGYDACNPQNDAVHCPNATACAANCVIEGVSDYGSMGISVNGSSVTFKLFTSPTTATSPRGYLLADENTYQTYPLLNREITYDVDVSTLGCGVNGALYLSEMAANGDASALNKAGPKYGTGYCDAQCPKNTFVKGVANINGTYGACCNEMDLWEANGQAQALTPHPCNATGVKLCQGTACSNDIAAGTCDQGGCDVNPYRLGNKDFYGPGKTIDTTKPFTVITQFITNNGRDDGDLQTIWRMYKQNGKLYQTPPANVTGLANYYNWINDDYCDAESKAFGGSSTSYPFKARGGMKQMGKALGRGMVLVLSIWEDSGSFMQWLDGQTGDITQPGNLRGPCSTTSGQPADVMAHNNNAAVTWSNIKFGELGTTF